MFEMLGVWMVSSLAIYITAALTPGFVIKGFGSAMIASLVVGLLNMTLWWVIFILTLPLTVLTLGLFTLVVNAIVLRAAAGLLKGFDIHGWLPAIIGAIILALVQSLLYWLFGHNTISS